MIGLWAFMQLTNKADMSQNPPIRQAMTDKSLPETPNERVKVLFDLRLKILKGGL
jgi:hypothetical protein